MRETHGFMEIELAKLLKIPYDEYEEGDSMAAVIEISDLYTFKEALLKIHTQNKDENNIIPSIISSATNGIAMVLTKYCFSDEFMDDFTDGRIKEQAHYLAIRKLGSPVDRFSYGEFKIDLKEAYNEIKNPAKTVEPAPVESVQSEPEKPKETEESIFIKKVIETISAIYKYKIFVHTDKSKVVITRKGEEPFIGSLNATKLADGLNKNIIITMLTDFLVKIKKLDKSLMMKYFVVYNMNPESIYDKFRNHSGDSKFLCLGRYVNKIYIPVSTLGSDDKGVSPYSKYDCIFKDTCTNILFALRDGYVLYSMIPVSSLVKKDVFDNVIIEIIRRWGNSLNISELNEIDKMYQKEILLNNKEEYVKFCLDNSNEYIKNIKKALTNASEEIGKLQKQLMEQLKMYRQYDDILVNFDEKKHEEIQAEKAFKNFDAVANLPQIKSIFIENDLVHIYTNDIDVQDPRTGGKLHNLGTYHIQLGMDKAEYNPDTSIVIKNTKHRVVGYSNDVMEAPHIFNGGRMCHGNLINSISEHYKDRDLYGVVMDLIIFLESVNVSDVAGAHINKWPVVEEKPKEENQEKKTDPVETEFDNVFVESLNTPVTQRA